MAQQQTVSQIIRTAVHREQCAYDFFMAMSDWVESPDIKFMFTELAQQELEHKEKLELELMKIGEVVKQNEYAEDGENPFYIDSEKYSEMDYTDLLRLCIEKEDLSFRFYINMAAGVNQEDSKDALLALAEEELGHKLRFETELEKLPRPK